MGLRKPKALLSTTTSKSTLRDPEYYNQKAEKIEKEHKTTKRYAEATEEAIARMESIWERYCAYVKIDQYSTLTNSVQSRFVNFLDWLCDAYTVRKVSTVETYWRTLSHLYNKRMGRRMDPMILRHIFEYINGELAVEHDLDDSEDEKPLLDIEDLWEVYQCLWVRDTNKFLSERERVELATLMLFAAYTASRPGALLGITYGDLDLFVQSDRKTDAVGLMLQVELTKTKARKKRARPKTYSFTIDDYPFFCVLSHILALARNDNALEMLPDDYTLSAERILKMGVRAGLNRQTIPFKPELKERPLFGLSYGRLNELLKWLGVEIGFPQVMKAYCLRRASGNAVNDDANSSDAVRNLVMDHTNSNIFCRNYLSRMIRFDVQAAYRGTDSKIDLIRAAGRMSSLMDPRRPKKLSEEQACGIRSDPPIQKLRAVQDELYERIRKKFKFLYKAAGEAIYCEYQTARSRVYSTIRSLERALLLRIQQEYDATAPLHDMMEQIKGNKEPIQAHIEALQINYCFPERFRIAKAFLDSRLELDWKINARAAFVDDLTSLCDRLETKVHTRKRKLTCNLDDAEPKPVGSDIKPVLADLTLAKAARVNSESAALTDRDKCKPLQCLICLGDSRLPRYERLHDYGSKDSLKRHFHRRHQKFERDSPCPHADPRCAGAILISEKDLLNHAARFHGIVMAEKTWTKERR